jgi:peptidoglycan pentaglycine glycine transferase (the first glycine)
MKIEEIVEKEIWKKFLEKSPEKYFLQSWEWGEFEKKGLGKKIWRLGFRKEEKLVGICLATEEIGRFGKFVYCPRGPILNWGDEKERVLALESLSGFFKDKGYIFLRLDPAIKKEKAFCMPSFRDAPNFVQVERAWMLDVEGRSEEELLLGMRKNARYSLKKAMKSGVEVKISKNPEEFEKFLDMLEVLAEDKSFASVPRNYLKKQFEMMGDIMKFFCAKKDGKVLAAGWFAFYGDESAYLHGASSKDVGDTQAPYLIQWEAIKYAKGLGIKRHNFWGVVEDKNYHPGYPGFGYSNFKKGFGGYLEEYIRTKDFVYNVVKYQLVRLNEWYRKVRYKGN